MNGGAEAGALWGALVVACLAFALGLQAGKLTPGQTREALADRERALSLGVQVVLYLIVLGLFLGGIGWQLGVGIAGVCGLVCLIMFVSGLQAGAARRRTRAREEAAPPPPGAWVRHKELGEALELLASRHAGRVVGQATRRVLDPDGRLVLEARPMGPDRVGIKLRARDQGAPGAGLVLTPRAWQAQRRRDEPLPAALATLGPEAVGRLDALLEEPGARRLVLGPGRPQLELALTPRHRLIGLQAHPPAGLSGRSEPEQLLAAHLDRLHAALSALAAVFGDGGAAAARQGAPAAPRVVLYDPAPQVAPAQRCPYCHTDLQEEPELAKCGRCQTTHHAACWEEAGGCTVLGCGARRAARSALRA